MRRQAVAANRDHALALQLSGHPPGRPAPVPIGATLIVSPVSIVHEWAKEIARHALGLRVFMYAGRKSNMLPEDTHQRGGCGVPPAPPPSAQCSYCWSPAVAPTNKRDVARITVARRPPHQPAVAQQQQQQQQQQRVAPAPSAPVAAYVPSANGAQPPAWAGRPPAAAAVAAAASSVATLPSAPRLVFGGEGALAWHRLAERG